MKKSRLTLLGCLLCTLVLSACQVIVSVEGDVNTNIDTNIDIDTDESDTGDSGDTGDTGESGDEGSTKEDVPTELTLTLSASATEVTVGDSVEISYTTNIEGALVSFSSSDTSLATVANNGHVTTLTAGVVTISGVASLEGYTSATDSVVITINPVDTGSGGGEPGGDEPGGEEPGEEPGTSDVTTYAVEITNGSSLTPLEIGETKTVSVSLLTYTNEVETGREDATASDVTLSSSVSDVISINGLEITAQAAGETYLTATWTEKEVQSSGVLVTVNEDTSQPEPEPEIKTVEVSFNPTSYTVEEESTVQTSLTTDPSGASVTYTSSDTNVATVNASGLVTGVKAGTTTITAVASYTDYNSGSATCTITVTEKVVEPEPSDPGYYVLYGDFVGAEWEDFPESSSIAYLGYTSDDTKYWEVTVTTVSAPDFGQWDPWNAGFRIIYAYWDATAGDDGEGANVYETIADYSALDKTNSTGTLGEGSDGNISLHWDTTYTITIDLRDSDNPYILVTMDTTGMEYDSCYVLYGDFVGSSWNDSPSESSDFYLAYNSADNSTKYWSVRVTTTSEPVDDEWWNNPNTWDAGFRIIAYGDYDSTIAGYSNLASGSTGVNGGNNNNEIQINWDTTYDIVIDMTGDTPSILVTLVTDTGGDSGDSGASETVTAEYALVGDFIDSSWKESPSKTSNYYHYYSSAEESTYTWELTVTMAADTGQDYDPSFYVTPYGDWKAVIGFSELDSNSTGVKDSASKDGGVCVDWGYTYDIVIDMSDSSNFSILVTLVTDTGGSSSGGSTSGESGDGLGLSATYAMGMDTSSIVEVLAAGAVMYDNDGNAIDDIDEFMSFVASQGINYIRIRLWVNPYDSYGNSYGGGHNDETTDLEIAEAAVKAGMKICLDIHYSDFWADRERQYCPSEWSALSGTSLNDAAASYTTSVLTDFYNKGVTPSMVQVGNETNNNSVCGTSGTSFFVACCKAVKDFDSSIKVVIHYADDQDRGTMASYFKALVNASCQFDIIGLSFYPFWHRSGSISTFQSDVEYFKSELSKDVCLMEYSYGFTTTWTNWGETYGQMSNTFNDTLQAVAGYEASPEGQAQCIYDINKAVVSAGGIGSFYWESAWISKMGTCWASSYSAEFYTNHGEDVTGWNFDTCSWANQALFDYDGKVLSSFSIYNQMWGK